MAGFLAPQIDDIRAPRDDSRPARGDTTIGDSLTGVAKLFDLAFSGTGGRGTQLTQKDRDGEVLQPFMKDVSRLFAKRDKLGSREYQVRLTSLFSSFAVTNNQLISEAQTGIEAITGIKVGTEEFDFAGDIAKSISDWMLNDDEGRVLAPTFIKYDDNGEVNVDLTILAGVEVRAQASADKAKLIRLNTELGIEQARSGINEVRLKGVVDEWLFKFGNEAQRHFEGVIRGALASNATLGDGATVLAQLRDQRAQLASRFEEGARLGGFANHPDWDVAIALRSYDNAITSLTDRLEDIPLIFNALKAADGITLGTILKGAMGVGAFQPQAWEYFLSNVIVGGSSKLTDLAKGLRASRTIETLADAPLFSPETTPVTEENPPVEGGATTPEAAEAAAGLDRSERQAEVTTGLANFGAYLTENAGNEAYRAVAVEGFALASLAMTTSPKPVGVDIFDKMYDTKFFDTYKSIVGFGDEAAGRLQNEVTHNLAVVFSQREKLALTRLANSFTTLPSFGLSFVDGKVELGFNAFGEGATRQEKLILSRLDFFGFPKNLEGIVKLRDREPLILSAADLGFASGNLRDLAKEVVYLNKIVSTISRLPDLSEHLLPKIEKGFAIRPVLDSVEDYNTIWPSLPHGQEYIVMGTDGRPILMKKGFESFLFEEETEDE